MWGRSDAENIYNHWATAPNKEAVSEASIKGGPFDEFLTKKDGFLSIVDDFVALDKTNGNTETGRQKTVEQIWKMVDKMFRRHGEIPARELLKRLRSNPAVSALLNEFEEDYEKLAATKKPAQKKIDEGRAVYLQLTSVNFPETKIGVKMLKKLGQGGYGAVYLAEGSDGKQYAVKQERGDYKVRTYKDTAYGRKAKVNDALKKFYEGDVTTTCLDYVQLGGDKYYLLKLGAKFDFAKVRFVDVVNVFKDLYSLQNYSANYMNVHITQDVQLFHFDIHPGNMMLFDGKLRLIDFGLSVIFDTDAVDAYLRAKPQAGDDDTFDGVKIVSDPKKSASRYIADWQKTLGKVNPTVIVCRGCDRQYPEGMTLTECFRCGSKKLEKAQLRQVDMEALAKLKGVPASSFKIDDPLKAAAVAKIRPEQYGCIVLTAVLIKAIIGAIKVKRNLDIVHTNLNVEVYSKARAILPRLKQLAAEDALAVELLVLWFDEMMRMLFAGTMFTAKDAAKYFDRGGTASLPPLQSGQRGRSQSVSF